MPWPPHDERNDLHRTADSAARNRAPPNHPPRCPPSPTLFSFRPNRPGGPAKREPRATPSTDHNRGVFHMDEQALRGLIADVKRGKLSRRASINRSIAVGLTAPFGADAEKGRRG